MAWESNRQAVEALKVAGAAERKVDDFEVVVDGKLDIVTQQLAETAEQVAESVNAIAMPVKQGVSSRSPKIVMKNANNDFSVLQKASRGYVLYKFDTKNGDTSTSSVGNSWDLLRLKMARYVNTVYLAKTQFTTDSGTLSTLYAPSKRNFIESELIRADPKEVQADFLSSNSDGTGIGLYGITGLAAISSVSFDLTVGVTRKANVLIYGSAGSSTSADILINDEVIKSFNPSLIAIAGTSYYKVVEFELPLKYSSDVNVKVKLRNNDVTNKTLYFSCANFVELDKYNGESVDMYKAFTTSKDWINASGSSDYAIYDNDLNKWCGSYHGGETRLSAKLTWGGLTLNTTLPKEWGFRPSSMRDVSAAELTSGMWTVVPTFRIEQLTNVNNKGKMLSIFSLDEDGTLQMDYSLYDCTIKTKQLYTALTATHISFESVFYPQFKTLEAPLTHLYLKSDEGRVIQRSTLNNLDLAIRYTMFGQRYNEIGAWVFNDATYYKKFYYGVVDGYTKGVIVPNLTFSKSLDFIAN